MNALLMSIKRFVKDEEGVTAIEYGLIAALIAVVIAGAVVIVGTQLMNRGGRGRPRPPRSHSSRWRTTDRPAGDSRK